MRNIYTVNAIQVVVSEQNPQGVKSNVSGYPIDFDSRQYNATEQNPNGSEEIALICAQAEFGDAVKALATANNANRVMWAVTLEAANGVQIAKRSFGAFPDMTPPAPEPNEEQE